jgi:hypothetical protein
MSDGREERKEEEERRRWEEERKNPDRHQGDQDRDWERDGERERLDSLAGGYGFYRSIDRSPSDQLIPRPLRKMPDFNAKVAHGVFDERGLAPTYPVSKSMELRTNGNYGAEAKKEPEPVEHDTKVAPKDSVPLVDGHLKLFEFVN